MNHETESSRELRFVCPECGSNSLWAYSQGRLEIEHVYDSGVITWDRMRPDEMREYHCGECGYELEFGEDQGIVEWLIAHCKQDESAAAQYPEDNSGAPPNNEG
jgi:predicted RNA-binding Zn-ribbon protein involved in translation (DUF1610 family)